MEITKEKLEELYWDKGMTQKEIGEYFNLTRSTIYYYFKKHNIKTRNCGEHNLKSNEDFLKEVRKQVGDEYVFLENYKKSMVKIKVKHNKCGYIYSVTPNAFLSKKNRCPNCKHTPPFTKEKAEELYYNKDLTQKEIGEIYGIADSAVCVWFKKYNIKSKTDISHITKEKLNNLYIEQELTQKECAEKLGVSEKTIREKMKEFRIKSRIIEFDYEYVYNYFKEQGCKLLSKTYRNTREDLYYICVCGNKSKTNFDNFRKSYRCWECRNKKYQKKINMIIVM